MLGIALLQACTGEVFKLSLAVEMKNITKRFPGVLANDDINFSVRTGEIHSLLGENGAGKTTLMKILFGLYRSDEGEIFIKGNRVVIDNSRKAIKYGLGMVHQRFMLVDRLSVLENVILGQEQGMFRLDLDKSQESVERVMKKYGFNLKLEENIENLSIGPKQRVEILKTLYRGADIIILDEPTAVLTPQEVDELFKILNFFKKQGKTIIFITHKLIETMEIADRITVLRDGKKLVTVDKVETSPEELARLMVGKDINFILEKKAQKSSGELLSLYNVKLLDNKKALSFKIHSGEILGVAGVEGNGQLELEEMVMGLRPVKKGKILFDKREITNLPTRERKLLGIGYIPSDRHRRAVISNFSIEENIILGFHFRPPFSKRGILNKDAIKLYANKMITDFDIKTTDSEQKIRFLSGGNQQKVIVSREVSRDPRVIVAAQPTRGLDIGAIEYIHSLLLELRNKGKAILLISADLTEVMKLSDRIAVLYEAEIIKIKDADLYDEEQIGLYMGGSLDIDE